MTVALAASRNRPVPKSAAETRTRRFDSMSISREAPTHDRLAERPALAPRCQQRRMVEDETFSPLFVNDCGRRPFQRLIRALGEPIATQPGSGSGVGLG